MAKKRSMRANRMFMTVLLLLLPVQPMLSLGMFYVSLIYALLPLLLIYHLTKNISRRRFRRKLRPMFAYIVFFYLTLVTAIIFSRSMSDVFVRWFILNLLSGLYYVVIVLYIKDINDLIYIVKVLCYGAFGQMVVLALVKFNLILSNRVVRFGISAESRFQGSFSGYELLAEYLGITFIIAVGLVMYFINAKKNIFWVFLLLLSILYVGIMTATRGFLIAIVAALLGNFIMGFLFSRQKFRQMYVVVAIAAILIMGYQFIIPQEAIDYNYSRMIEAQYSGEQAFNRVMLYRASIASLKGMPVTGWGSQMMIVFNSRINGNFVSPHSMYMYMLLFAGYLGLLAFLLMILKLIRVASLNVKRTKKNSALHSINIAVFTMWLYWFISQAKIDVIRQPSYLGLIMVYIGITNAMNRCILDDASSSAGATVRTGRGT